MTKPKILLIDVETAPILASVWALFDQNVGLNQIERDWFLLSFSAHWLDAPNNEIIYMDQSKAKNIEDDSRLLRKLWELLDKADIVVGQNSKRFDVKKINARFILQGMKPPSSFKQIDTLEIAKRKFAFTSNKLEYLTNKLCKKHKKLTKRKYSGFELWKECLSGNKEAWAEMKRYNIEDVLSLQELYHILTPWDSRINFNLYNESDENVCNCGSKDIQLNGFHYTPNGKFQRYRCSKCGTEVRAKTNLLSKEKRASLKPSTN